eukprot:TRINITY_DN9464_c1_g1_i1.p1 TRINITY_DN9464_c1_g1~~TRINITY_DN9464_c1_g1_i1.p1  ORF type:complete len:120 (+),score=10.78 TRINITY_DN9464_c1_g1_i1:100-459(+)
MNLDVVTQDDPLEVPRCRALLEREVDSPTHAHAILEDINRWPYLLPGQRCLFLIASPVAHEREEADTFTAAIRAGPTPPPSRPSSERGGSTIMVLAGPKQNCHRRLHLHHYHYHHLRLH